MRSCQLSLFNHHRGVNPIARWASCLELGHPMMKAMLVEQMAAFNLANKWSWLNVFQANSAGSCLDYHNSPQSIKLCLGVGDRLLNEFWFSFSSPSGQSISDVVGDLDSLLIKSSVWDTSPFVLLLGLTLKPLDNLPLDLLVDSLDL